MRVIIFSVLLTFLFFLVIQKVYHLPYSYGDDHRLLAMLHPENVSPAYKAALFGNNPDVKGSLNNDLHIGRFEPLGWIYNKLLCLTCGDSTVLFRLSNLVILFISSCFLLCIFTFFSVDWPSSLVVLAIYFFGKNNEIWWTHPSAQDIGEMFLLAGIYCWLQYRKKGLTDFYMLPALLFLLAGLTKESFNFCIPVLLLTDYFFFNPAKRLLAKEYRLSLAICLVLFSCLVATMLYSKRIYSYASPESALSIIRYNIFEFSRAAIFFIAPIVALAMGRRTITNKILLKLLLVFGIWTILQLILLKGIKLNGQHHYLIPWLIYPLILTVLAFRALKKIPGKWYASMLVIYGMAALLFAKNTYVNSSAYTASLQAYYTMINTIRQDVAAPEIVYLSNDACEKDWIEGTRIILDNMAIRKELFFATTVTSIPYWEVDYTKHSRQNTYTHISLDSLFHSDGKWIILVETPAENGIINDPSIALYRRKDSSFIKINRGEKYIDGSYFYFSEPYPDGSISNILRGNFTTEDRKGFYAIKMNPAK